MANTSPEPEAPQSRATRVLDACLSGGVWDPKDIDALVDSGSDALFHIVAEGLADRFDPHLAAVYANIFTYAIARVDRRYTVEHLRYRYGGIRHFHPLPEQEPKEIVLLSRVTLGADIAVTSIVAQALKVRFPGSEVLLAGNAKSAELLGLPLLAIDYPRSGGLRERLGAADALSKLDSDTLIVDPDSRLTQLGLYPVVPDERYCFFDSRSVTGPGSLVDLTRDWCSQVFETGVAGPKIHIPEAPVVFERPAVTVSLGVGGNEEKRCGAWFERELLRELSSRFATVIVDKGAGKEEAARAEEAAKDLANVQFWSGSFSAFSALIARSDLYVGYDSAGQHAAAALGIPLVSVFAGAVNDQFYERWRPKGRVIRVDGGSPEATFLRVRTAIRANNSH